MKFLAILSIIIILADVVSIPMKYLHDRSPRPAWKKSYALRFGIFSFITDVVLITAVAMMLRRVW